MINNDILRRVRFVFEYSNAKMITIFAKAKVEISTEQIIALLKKEEEEGYQACNDTLMCQFLDGLIIENRGLKPGAEIPTPLKQLTNNLIFKKLRVALELREEDIIAALASADFAMSKSELGALFRSPDHKNYKACGDQVLRNFIKGLSIKHRGV
ncbi:YehS family protein [Shewanella sp.]|uniref:YehS family protein n=1 Tax=Shewanella sp. TaxID=50422 RepID=UPI004053C35D